MKLIKATLLLCILINPSLFGQDPVLRRQIENTIKFNLFGESKVVPGFIVDIINDYKTCVEVPAPVTGTKTELIKDDYLKIENISKEIIDQVAPFLVEQDIIKTKRRKNHFLPVDFQNTTLDQQALFNHLNIENILSKVIPGPGTRETKGHYSRSRNIDDVLFSFSRDFVREEDLAKLDSNPEYGLLKICLGKAFNKDLQIILNETIINTG
jgi:hypothetical protein